MNQLGASIEKLHRGGWPCGLAKPVGGGMLAPPTAWRRGIVAGSCVLLGALAAAAQATVTLNYTTLGSPTLVNMYPGYWTDYSSTCVDAGGSLCLPTNQPGANPDNLLFSWGVAGSAKQLHPECHV
jgi:hypothetical protein